LELDLLVALPDEYESLIGRIAAPAELEELVPAGSVADRADHAGVFDTGYGSDDNVPSDQVAGLRFFHGLDATGHFGRGREDAAASGIPQIFAFASSPQATMWNEAAERTFS
jgi:hypothetical protein